MRTCIIAIGSWCQWPRPTYGSNIKEIILPISYTTEIYSILTLPFHMDVCIGIIESTLSISKFTIHGMQTNNRYEGIDINCLMLVVGY